MDPGLAFAELAVPAEMTTADGTRVLEDLERAARNAHRAGYQLLELHGANGYLFHAFLSPLANARTDQWGGDLDGRMRFPLEMVEAVRAGWPEDKPLVVRLPATDLLDGGLTTDDTTVLAARMAAVGVDMVDLSSGALTPTAARTAEPLHSALYGPLFRSGGMLAAASGSISENHHLHEAIPELVDAVLVGRALLRDPYWALRARDADPHDVAPAVPPRVLTADCPGSWTSCRRVAERLRPVPASARTVASSCCSTTSFVPPPRAVPAVRRPARRIRMPVLGSVAVLRGGAASHARLGATALHRPGLRRFTTAGRSARRASGPARAAAA